MDSAGLVDELAVLGGATILGGVAGGCPTPQGTMAISDVYPDTIREGEITKLTISGKNLPSAGVVKLLDAAGLTRAYGFGIQRGLDTLWTAVRVQSAAPGPLKLVVADQTRGPVSLENALEFISGASATSALPDTITGISDCGDGYVTYGTDANGIHAGIGRWDAPCCAEEPQGVSVLCVDIDVRQGKRLDFTYQVQSYDVAEFDWLDISVFEGTNRTNELWHYGSPAGDWCVKLWRGPRLDHSIDLHPWLGKQIEVQFSVRQDGPACGDQTQALITNLSFRPCWVAPLKNLSQDAQRYENGLFDTEHITDQLREALGCFESAIQHAGGFVTHESAYRTSEYQLHLQEVWAKYQRLRGIRDPDCQDVKASVDAEAARHHLTGLGLSPAGENGPHVLGIAADLPVTGLPLSTIDAIANSCVPPLYRPHPRKDKWHFQLR